MYIKKCYNPKTDSVILHMHLTLLWISFFHDFNSRVEIPVGGGGGVLPCMGCIGMCRCKGYGFQAVYSSIGYINQSVWV